jgi:two-component system nitrogen regulation response regulator NtrX
VLEYEGYTAIEASRGAEALEHLKTEKVDAMLLDIKMPGMDGMEVLKQAVASDPGLPIIMISGHGTISTAVEATKVGAFDFLEKPLDRDRILLTVRNAISSRMLSDEKASLEKAITKEFQIKGESPAIADLLATIERIGPTQARVLITGENGVGKGIVARAIHKASDRAKARFVEVCCAAIPDDLIESELLGHEKGAFTGALTRKPGKFELADGGTVFLDEIGDMSPKVQAKVLRVLEEGEFERVGGTETVAVDVRVIAATNKDLRDLIDKGEFREDLYYRLNVVPIAIPPLRRRKEDIPVLAEHFLKVYCDMYGLKPKTLNGAVIESLADYPWPGNVRELRNIIERMVITSQADDLSLEDLPPLAEGSLLKLPDYGDAETYEEFKSVSEKRFLETRLTENNWNIALTARKLGMQRSNLYKKMQKLDINVKHKD